MRELIKFTIMEWNGEQIELFPKVTKSELKDVKLALSLYRRMKSVIDDFENIGIATLESKQIAVYNAYKAQVIVINRAINLIQDEEVKRIIVARYINGLSHSVTLMRFAIWHPSTVDRKINLGIESIANTMKIWEF